jgi:hypothetical protein
LRAKSLLLTHLGSDVRARVSELEADVRGAPIPVRFADDRLVLEL